MSSLVVARQVFFNKYRHKERMFEKCFIYFGGSGFVRNNDKRDSMVNLVSITFFIFARIYFKLKD